MSALRRAFEDYFELRRALGFKLLTVERALRRFVEFAENEGASFITTELAMRWAQRSTGCDLSYQAIRLQMVRQFARYCSTLDPRTEIPSDGLLPHKIQRRDPYLYSDAEIVRLIEAAKTLPSPTGLRAATYSTLLGLIAVTGMRRSESTRLDRDDVDLVGGVITVRHSKFDRSRHLPLHPSTQKALRKYEEQRDRLCPHPLTQSFFVSEQGTRVRPGPLYCTFVKLSHQIGLRGPDDRHGPRLHDMRHSFALKTVLRWYREGHDVERDLPRLATYLGHVHINDTYWYLTATSELLHSAARRLDDAEEEERP